jgi:hypothetical protein
VSRSLLLPLTATYVALVALHDVDHVVSADRLGGVPPRFGLILAVQYALLAGFAVLIRRGDRLGAGAALLLGLGGVAVFAGAHLLPFGPLPYGEHDPAAISWAALFVPMAVAAALATAAAVTLRAKGAAGAPRAR